jgi:hypothetical protein
VGSPARPADEARHDGDDRRGEQDMDQRICDVKSEESEQPENQEDHGDAEHLVVPLSLRK